MARKDKSEGKIFRHLNTLDYENHWDSYTSNSQINKILSKASKNGKGNQGIPDQIYVNEINKLLIIMEIKTNIGEHAPLDGVTNPEKYAVCGVKWYIKHFLQKNIINNNDKEYFKDWKIVGLAVSGDIEDVYNHRISSFTIIEEKIIEQKSVTNILNEIDYLNLFENVDEEKIIDQVTNSSNKINKWLRSVDSQKRPILLSALMICLFEIKTGGNSFITEYNSNTPKEIVSKIQDRVDKVLESEEIPKDKREVLNAELEFIKYDVDINNTDVLKNILNELRDSVIPLFSRKSNYDIIGKFYEEFLRFAGVANVKKGIVLTPSHITTLFTKLIDIKINDVILDTCCGTGAFLISGMNTLIEEINKSSMLNKDQIIKDIKEKQLVGFEKNTTMYALAISNMLFRGDGKSQIFNYDCFSDKAIEELENLKKEGIYPTIGFINPPYGGRDNKTNPTKKEIQFLTQVLDNVSRYGVIIAPLSTYFKDNDIRNNILRNHTLKYVINMPKDLFLPNAATNTAVAVFETNKPHGDQEVVMYDLIDDGYVLSKSKGRTDVYNKWNKIETELLEKINNPDDYIDNMTLLKTKIKDNDEWLIQAHSDTDYSKLNEDSFIDSIKEHLIFTAKQEMDLLEEDLDEITLLDIVSDFYNTNQEEFEDDNHE